MAWHNDLGKWGEDRAAEYLEQHGWYIRHRNWQKHHHELDIVAIDADSTMLLIVEVKTRATDAFGSPDEAITLEKKHHLMQAVRSYIFDFHMEHLEVRYDTINVVGTPETGFTIEHKEGSMSVVDNFLYYEQRRRNAHWRYKHRPGCW